MDVLVVDRSRLIGSVMSAVLREYDDIRVIGTITTEAEALEALRAGEPAVVLVSTNLPRGGTLKLLRALGPQAATKTLVVGVPEDTEAVLRYIEAGAAGYVLREDSEEDLVQKLRAVHRGEALISPDVAAALIARVAELAEARQAVAVEVGALAELTRREQEVLDLLGQGLTNQEIADRLYIGLGTVKNHVHHILNKLDLSSRWDAADYWDAVQGFIG
jgi:DNA-binding NarL/FixJ family response regulator